MAASTNRKNRKLIRFNSGGGVYFKKNGATTWENLGEVEVAVLERKSATNKAGFMSGDTLKKRGERTCDLKITLSQDDKTVMDRIDALLDDTCAIMIDNGLEGGKYQEFYLPECEIMENMSITMGGSKQQTVGLDISVYPQGANVSCTPDTDLPDEARATGASPVTGTNPFYLILETVAV